MTLRRLPRLVGLAIACAILLRFAPAYLSAQTPAAVPSGPAALLQLQDRCLGASAGRAAIDVRTGSVRFVGTQAGRPIAHPEPAAAAGSPETAARAYFAVCGTLFGLADQAGELAMTSSSQAEGARRIVRFRQRHDGVPVLGGEVIVHLDAAGNIVTVAGETLPSPQLDTVATLDPGEAAQTAIDLVARTYGINPAQLSTTTPELWIYDPAMIGPERGPARLVWRMDVTPAALEPIRELVLVDARRGSVALHFNAIETARNRNTYTASNTTTLPGALVCIESNPACAGGDADAAAAHVFAADTYNFYLNNLGRDSLNNAGMTLVSTVHYGPVTYQNAFWNGSQMAYGNGFSLADDVVGHELTHGVTQYTSNLLYYYQSGAINESLSDVFGELIDLTNGSANDLPQFRWLMGEEIGAIRNMQNPPAYSDPDRMTSALYYTGASDNGGVHTNSGINNKAAYLMVDGGTFNGQTIAPLGALKVAKIYYEAQTHLLTSGSDYGDLFEALYQACNNLVGVATAAADCQQVRNATLAVEMQLQPVSGFNPEAPLCSAGQNPVPAFFDNLEAGTGNFTLSSASGGVHWKTSTGFAHSGVRSLWADDFPSEFADASAAMTTGVVLPANAFLHFAHAFELLQGPGSDGAVVEYSTNNGASWIDAGGLFDANSYRGTINSASNPLNGRAAFVGVSHGYISSRLNLASLAGQSVRFRWRLGLDVTGGAGGWFVDDVRIYTCSGTGLTGVSPRSTPQGFANLNIAVTGQSTHFVQGQTTATFGPGVIVHGTSVSDATHASVHISVPSDAAVGPRDVILTTGSEVAIGVNGFNVTAGATITRITPNRAQPGQQGLSVDVTATLAHFQQGQTAVSFGSGITVTGVKVIDTNRLTATVVVDANAPLGGRTVQITSGNELLTRTNGFTVRRLPAQTQAFAYALGKYPSSGGNYLPQTVAVIDTSSNAITTSIPIGRSCFCVGTDGITVAPDGATVYATNDQDNTISVIDAVTNTVTATFPTGTGGPAAVAVSPEGERLYVLIGNPGAVRVFDTSTYALLSSVNLGVMQSYGMAMSPDGARLYISTYASNTVKVVDTATLAVVATIPVGLLPLGLDVSPDGSLVYVANGTFSQSPVPGSVSIISTSTNTVVAAVGVGVNPYTAQASPDGTRAYVANASSAGVSIINAATGAFSGSVSGNTFAYTVGFTPDGSRAYATTGFSIQVVNVASNAVVGSIPANSNVLGYMLSMAMSPGATRAMTLTGDLDFGVVSVGRSVTRTLTVTNTGNSPLAVSALGFPAGFDAAFGATSIPAGGSQQVPVTFRPTRAGAHAGSVTLSGNQTSGRTTLAVSGYGVTETTRDSDFDRDTATDITIFRPSSGSWFILRSSSAFSGGAVYSWGVATDVPMPGDYDGDSRTDVAVYRPASGHWFILTSRSNYSASLTYQWGTTGDLPVAGDFDGDARSDLAIYRPSTGAWYVLRSSSGYTAGAGYVWGAAGDIPVPGDYDGDGLTDPAVYRPSTGHWFVLQSTTNYTAWATYQWGTTGDVPVAGDYDGDNRRDLAIYRPSTGGWFVLRSSSGFSAGAGYVWGVPGDVPVPGDFDGDGLTDLAVFRPSSGHWFIRKSSTGYMATATYQWGTAGDIAVIRR